MTKAKSNNKGVVNKKVVVVKKKTTNRKGGKKHERTARAMSRCDDSVYLSCHSVEDFPSKYHLTAYFVGSGNGYQAVKQSMPRKAGKLEIEAKYNQVRRTYLPAYEKGESMKAEEQINKLMSTYVESVDSKCDALKRLHGHMDLMFIDLLRQKYEFVALPTSEDTISITHYTTFGGAFVKNYKMSLLALYEAVTTPGSSNQSVEENEELNKFCCGTLLVLVERNNERALLRDFLTTKLDATKVSY